MRHGVWEKLVVMTGEFSASGISLPRGASGSSFFHRILQEAVARFPRSLTAAQLPSNNEDFKRSYGASLSRFEAARVEARERVDVARFLFERTQALLQYGDAPLVEYLQARSATPRLEGGALGEFKGLPLEVPFEGAVLRGSQIHDLVEDLFARHQLTAAARSALHWSVTHGLERGGVFDLRSERFVLLGAGAELAATPLLLKAGATVLWIDLADPTPTLANQTDLGGALLHAPGANDLLDRPREVAAAIRAFAEGGPVHVGMLAYAPGASRELRLGVAMNAIVSSLEPGLVRSIFLLVSPTTPALLSEETLRSKEERFAGTPRWQKSLESLGVLRRPGHVRIGSSRVSSSVVSLQGVSYQAAQYIAKIAAAECYAVHGARADGREPVTVSANVAGITRTRSLAHPLFQAAFDGAPKFGVRIFDPATTRALSTLLLLHDLLNPEAPGSRANAEADPRRKAANVFSQQIHGGIHSLPFELENAIKVAAVLGLAGRPSLVLPRTRARRDKTADLRA